MSVPAPPRRSRLWLAVVIILLLALAGGAYAVATGRLSLTPAAPPIETGQVTTITAVSSIEGTGPVAAQQSGSIFWKTTGLVAEVLIKPGAPVHILVVPKKVIPRIAEAQLEDHKVLGHILLKAAEIAEKAGLKESGYRLVINNGPDAGESVPHLHCHILGGRHMSWPPG